MKNKLFLIGVLAVVSTPIWGLPPLNSTPQDLSVLAPSASPNLTGTPTVPTATLGTSTTQIASTAFATATGAAVQSNIPRVNVKTNCPVTLDNAVDSTIALNSCFATGGAASGYVEVPNGILRGNLSIPPASAGVMVHGAGMGYAVGEGPQTSNYMQGVSTTAPTITVGDDSATMTGVTLQDFSIKTAYTTDGIVLGGGTMRTQLNHIQMYSNGAHGIYFKGSTDAINGKVSVHNMLLNSYVREFADQGEAISLIDNVNSSTIFNNDHIISNNTGKAAPGSIMLHVVGSSFHGAGDKFDMREGGVIVEKGTGNVPPVLDCFACEFDSPNSADMIVALKGYTDPVSSTRFDAPIRFGLHVDGAQLIITNQTTGTFAAAATTFTPASLAGFWAGRYFLARTPASTFSARISNVNTSTGLVTFVPVTAGSGAPAAGTNVEVDVGYRMAGVQGFAKADEALQGSRLMLRGQDVTEVPPLGLSPQITQGTGNGAVAPFTRLGMHWFMPWNYANSTAEPIYFWGDVVAPQTASNVTWNAGVLSVYVSGPGIRTDSLLQIDGANEDINGPCAITGYFTTYYTCIPAQTASLSGTGTATGTINVRQVGMTLKMDAANGLTLRYVNCINYSGPSGTFCPVTASSDGGLTHRGASLSTSFNVFTTGTSYVGQHTIVERTTASGGSYTRRVYGDGSWQQPTGLTVSTLPTCNTAATGTMSWVSDATSPTYLGTLTGGGSVVTPAFCNGTNWVAH